MGTMTLEQHQEITGSTNCTNSSDHSIRTTRKAIFQLYPAARTVSLYASAGNTDLCGPPVHELVARMLENINRHKGELKAKDFLSFCMFCSVKRIDSTVSHTQTLKPLR